jgi:hypothetical protein
MTIGVKLTLPDAAFLNQMWIAGLLLAALLVWRSMAAPAPAMASPAPAADSALAGPVVPQRDMLFDALCAGVVVCTAVLYIVFF